MTTHKLNSKLLAEAWATTAVATGSDASRPMLYRTCHVEVHETGLLLVATDSHLLITTAVPFFGEPTPTLDWAAMPDPVAAITVYDLGLRVRSFLGHAARTAQHIDVTVDPSATCALCRGVGDVITGAEPNGKGEPSYSTTDCPECGGTGTNRPTLEPGALDGRFELSIGTETITRTSAGPTYPNWREVVATEPAPDDPERRPLWNPALLRRVGTLPMQPGDGLEFRFRGAGAHMTEFTGVTRRQLPFAGLFMGMARREHKVGR
jgi:hypothetical protein